MTPFAIPNANCYTTTDVNLANTAQNFAFGPTHTAADQNQTYFRTTTVGVWAVRLETAPTPVPEPPTLMLILAGIVGLAACRARALRPGGEEPGRAGAPQRRFVAGLGGQPAQGVGRNAVRSGLR